jgi:hypothetical protein
VFALRLQLKEAGHMLNFARGRSIGETHRLTDVDGPPNRPAMRRLFGGASMHPDLCRQRCGLKAVEKGQRAEPAWLRARPGCGHLPRSHHSGEHSIRHWTTTYGVPQNQDTRSRCKPPLQPFPNRVHSNHPPERPPLATQSGASKPLTSWRLKG